MIETLALPLGMTLAKIALERLFKKDIHAEALIKHEK
jgi:hypothetical protein